jgi:riboflavin kinase/FMN adenylyltransferase
MLCKAVNQLPMIVVGIVQHGQQKARLYGTPTTNIAAHLDLSPGVYGGLTSINETNLIQIPSLCYVSEGLVESYLIDQDVLLYGAEMVVKLLWFHRPPTAFQNDMQMASLIQKDLASLRNQFIAKPT